MPTCDLCGNVIEFRVIDGQTVPLHLNGGCWGEQDSAPSTTVRPKARRWFRTGAAYLTPNARCPECDAPVYFYRSPDDGRVYFNEPGPPWPKHPCTDNSNHEIPLPLVSAKATRPLPNSIPKWVSAGYEALCVEGARLQGTGIWIRGQLWNSNGRTSRLITLVISAKNRLRWHSSNPELVPWGPIGAQRWRVLAAADSGLVMARLLVGGRIALSMIRVEASSSPDSTYTEVLEVEGDISKD